jgi:two-component system C4-dicarboxylate transport response regulator DctD
MQMRHPSNPLPVAPEGQRPAVLIVEDERIARRALAALLAASGFETCAAESAEEALRLLAEKQERPEHADRRIALVDLNLPGMNGLEFITRLEGMDPDVFPVLMTAASDEVVGEALRDRNLVYLRKPLDLNQLLNVISHPDQER